MANQPPPPRPRPHLRHHDFENVDEVDAVVPLIDHRLRVEARHVEVRSLAGVKGGWVGRGGDQRTW